MELQDILFFLIFVGYWVFSLLFKKVKKEEKATEKKGFTLRVLEFINTLKEASEKEQNYVESQTSVQTPSDIPPPTARSVTEKEHAPHTIINQATKEHRALSVKALDIGKQPPVVKEYHKKIVDKPKSSLVTPGKKGVEEKFPKQKMRDAIIWSEILGPPVALRDN